MFYQIIGVLKEWVYDYKMVLYRRAYAGSVAKDSQDNLTNNSSYDALPVWSKNGNEIYFYSVRDFNEEIYKMKSDGTLQVNVSNNPDNESAPCFKGKPR